jgi:hypothetical protein
LLHSWSIAFDCWNSNSKFEFYLFEPFQNVQIFFLTNPCSTPIWPSSPLNTAATHRAFGSFFFFFPRSSPTRSGPPTGPASRRYQAANPPSSRSGPPAGPVAARPLRLLPCPQPMTGGDHLSSPTSRVPAGLGRESDPPPPRARTCGLGPHA